ncbi:hypothetical protein [Treponema primitia]|uniref:hypothetical protein n=1 Tax=Treponema primitia TaxID=88058 RepID=UPI0018E15881|nr:hypothetical protein [Treponema primitia]
MYMEFSVVVDPRSGAAESSFLTITSYGKKRLNVRLAAGAVVEEFDILLTDLEFFATGEGNSYFFIGFGGL